MGMNPCDRFRRDTLIEQWALSPLPGMGARPPVTLTFRYPTQVRTNRKRRIAGDTHSRCWPTSTLRRAAA